MTALLRYQADLLVRSQRWLPPFILYAVFLGVGVQGGQPVLDSLGYALGGPSAGGRLAGADLRANEPPAARAAVAAAAGPGRAHLACLLVALAAAAALGTVATVLVTLISDPASADHQVRVELLPAGARRTARRPGVRPARHGRRRAHDLAAAALARPGGPRDDARRAAGDGGDGIPGELGDHVPGDRLALGHVPVPLLPLAGAALLTVAATAVACALTSRRSP